MTTELSFIDKLKLFSEWAPLLAKMQSVLVATTPQEKALAVVQVAQWAAGKTSTSLDDDALEHLESVLKTPEGAAAFDWLVKLIGDAV